jgi:hypothetical protein
MILLSVKVDVLHITNLKRKSCSARSSSKTSARHLLVLSEPFLSLSGVVFITSFKNCFLTMVGELVKILPLPCKKTVPTSPLGGVSAYSRGIS